MDQSAVSKLFPVTLNCEQEVRDLLPKISLAKELDDIPIALLAGVKVEKLSHIKIKTYEYFCCVENGFIVFDEQSIYGEHPPRKIFFMDFSGQKAELGLVNERRDIIEILYDRTIIYRDSELIKTIDFFDSGQSLQISSRWSSPKYLFETNGEKYYRRDLLNGQSTLIGIDHPVKKFNSGPLEKFNWFPTVEGDNVIYRWYSTYVTFDKQQKPTIIRHGSYGDTSVYNERLAADGSIFFHNYCDKETRILSVFKNGNEVQLTKGGHWTDWDIDKDNNIYIVQNDIMYKITLPKI